MHTAVAQVERCWCHVMPGLGVEVVVRRGVFLGGVWGLGQDPRGGVGCGHGRLWSMGYGVGWRGGGVGGAGGGVSVSWCSWLVGVVFGLQSCSGSGVFAERGPGWREKLQPQRYLFLSYY